jgi:hypothetical protein
VTEYSHDGQPIQAGLVRSTYALTGQRAHFSIMDVREMVVIARYYVDDERNRSKRFVEYTCRDLHTSESFPGCRQLSPAGGVEDGDDNPLRPSTSFLPGSSSTTGALVTEHTPAKDVDGDQVLVGFISGSRSRPVIVGVFRHSGSQYGATSEQGERRLTQHKGLTIELNAKGEYALTHKSGSRIVLLDSGDVQARPAAGKKLFHGDVDATENHVLGQQLKQLLSDAIDALLSATYPTGLGPTGTMLPPAATQLQTLQSNLDDILSNMAFTQKDQG